MITKSFKNFNNRSELIELFETPNILNVEVGKNLEVALGIVEEYNSRNQTLFGYPFNWTAGNSINIKTAPKSRNSVYNTVNAKPADYQDFIKASVLVSMDKQKNVSLTETFGLAVKALLEKLGVGDGDLYNRG